MKILILKPSSLGDVIQALPVLRFLKHHLPKSEIYWWIESGLAPLLEADPDLAGILQFNRKRWAAPQNWNELWRSLRWMRDQQFDWVIDLQGLARSGAFAWLANGKLTVGMDEPREGARGFYDLIVPRSSFHTHAVDWYLEVLPVLGLPRAKLQVAALNGEPANSKAANSASPFVWLHERPEIAASIRVKWPVAEARWILIQPGARWANKRWPAEFFAKLVRLVGLAQPQFRLAILGSREDSSVAEAIDRANAGRCLDLTGKTSLPEMIEWIRASELMITNDTGPMHVAAALNKPLVALFGPTEPSRTGPYGQLEHVLRYNLPCTPCLSQRCRNSKPMECLQSISPATVLQAVEQRLAAA